MNESAESETECDVSESIVHAFNVSGRKDLDPQEPQSGVAHPWSGIPDRSPDQILKATIPVNGFNAVPPIWWGKISNWLINDGRESCRFGVCVFFFRDPKGPRAQVVNTVEDAMLTVSSLIGVLCLQVVDVATGGATERYQKSIERMKRMFSF